MPVIKTNNGTILDFRFELAVPRGANSPYKLVHVTPEGNEVTEAEAKAACNMYPFVVLVNPPEVKHPLSKRQEEIWSCEEHDKKYVTQRGYDNHLEAHHTDG